jgi:thiosulfate/3-mercaptopyruvate sulfurtransferase
MAKGTYQMNQIKLPLNVTRLLIAVLAVTLLSMPLSALAHDLAPSEGSAVAPYAKPDILVDTEWVLKNGTAKGVRLVHLGGKPEDYAAGHVPSAVYLNLNDLVNPDNPVQGQIATGPQVATALGKIGVTENDTVILLDANSSLLASRAYWVLKYYQHKDVRVYNGGQKKWVADGQALATDAPEVKAATYTIAEADPEIRTTGEYVLEHLDDADVQLCDARSVKEFIGTDVRADRGGHIPGAINLDWVNTVEKDGTFKSEEDLTALFEKAGFKRDKQIITYCQTGVRGAHVWFILRELLGYPDVRNYDGSWVEWGNNPNAPIEN